MSLPSPWIFPLHHINPNLQHLTTQSSAWPPFPTGWNWAHDNEIFVFGVPSYAEDEVNKFSSHFSWNVAPQFLGPVSKIFTLLPSGRLYINRVIHIFLNFVVLAIELSMTYNISKPHINLLLYKVGFSTIYLAPDDIDMFEYDPH